jgi:hypothetical protein
MYTNCSLNSVIFKYKNHNYHCADLVLRRVTSDDSTTVNDFSRLSYHLTAEELCTSYCTVTLQPVRVVLITPRIDYVTLKSFVARSCMYLKMVQGSKMLDRPVCNRGTFSESEAIIYASYIHYNYQNICN